MSIQASKVTKLKRKLDRNTKFSGLKVASSHNEQPKINNQTLCDICCQQKISQNYIFYQEIKSQIKRCECCLNV